METVHSVPPTISYEITRHEQNLVLNPKPSEPLLKLLPSNDNHGTNINIVSASNEKQNLPSTKNTMPKRR